MHFYQMEIFINLSHTTECITIDTIDEFQITKGGEMQVGKCDVIQSIC